MDQQLIAPMARARKLSTIELRQDMASQQKWSPMHLAAENELARRESRKAFWRKDLWTWVAVAISLISLALSGLTYLHISLR
jgi:hypothetical protein